LADAIQDVVGNHPGLDFKPLQTDNPTKAEEVLGGRLKSHSILD